MTTDYRDILPGKEFDRYFPKPTNTHKVAVDLGDVFDTIVEMQAVVDSSLEDTKKIAKTFASSNLEQTCRKIFSFCYNYIQYEQDDDGIEQLRTPARIWADRKRGVDCDDYAILIASILTNLNIPCYFRMTKYGREHYQHIYIIVPKATGLSLNNKANYYAIDPVVDRFNYEVPFSAKHDKKVMMPIHVLSGIGDADVATPYNPLLDDLGDEFETIGESLKGLGSVSDADIAHTIQSDFLMSMKKHLINTVKMLETMPDNIVDEETRRFKTRLEYLLHNFDDPERRDEALKHLIKVEELEIGLNSEGLGLLKKVGNFFKKVGDGIADVAKGAAKGVANASKWVAGKVADGASAAWEGISNAGKWVGKTAEKGWDGIKDAAKAVGKFVVRFNPLFIAIRNGILLAMKINLFRMAERMGYGYWTEEEAQAKGLDMPNYRKMKEKLDWLIKKFKQMGGKEENLRKNVMQGWDKGTKKRNLIRGLGAGLAATIATAMTVISALLQMIKGILPAKGTKPEDYPDDNLSEEELNQAANAVDNQTYDPDLPFMINQQQGNVATGNSGMLMAAAGGLLLLGFAMKNRQK